MSGRVLRTIGPIFKNSMLSAAILFYSPMHLQRGFARPIAQSAVQRSALTFDVVSIRRNSGDDRPWGFYPDSYRAIDMPIWRTISYAYFPMRFHDREWIRNAPSWVFDDKYDLVAKVAPEDVNAWQILKQQQLAGIEVREAAERLRVTLETARFHLKRVLSKTGVRRQAELIRLMLLLPGC